MDPNVTEEVVYTTNATDANDTLETKTDATNVDQDTEHDTPNNDNKKDSIKQKKHLLSQLSGSIQSHGYIDSGSDMDIEVVTPNKRKNKIETKENNDDEDNEDDNDFNDLDLEEKKMGPDGMIREITNSKTKKLKYGNSPSISDSEDSDSGPIIHGYTILDESLSTTGAYVLPMPYKNDRGCLLFHKIGYWFETLIVKNPRLFSLWLLYKCVFPRALVLVDMWTDALVAYQLLRENETLLFALSCLFIVFPFYMVWNTSLRFVQKFMSHNKRKIGYLLNVALILYLFPPIGCVVVTCYEIVGVFYDIFIGLYSFCRVTILLIDKEYPTDRLTTVYFNRKQFNWCL